MAFRPELDAAIQAEAARPDSVGWGCDIDFAGASPNIQVTIYNEAGTFRQVVTVLASEGLTVDEIIQQFQMDTIDEVRRRRQG